MDRELEEGEGTSSWFLLREAECEDDGSDTDSASIGGASISGLISDGEEDQGNSLELFTAKCQSDDSRQLAALKRKYISPQKVDISPRLNAISISPEKKKGKRRLVFITSQDSALGTSLGASLGNEAVDGDVQDAIQVEDIADRANVCTNANVLNSATTKKAALWLFKEAFGVSFTELSRVFKSDRTCNTDWVLAVANLGEELSNSLKVFMQQQSTYIQYVYQCVNRGSMSLMLLRFKATKCRDTLHKLVNNILRVDGHVLLTEPPRTQSVPAALFWHKLRMSNACFTAGDMPEWVVRQTSLSHQIGEDSKFDLSVMVQWAYDNGHTEESAIAYNYAREAETDTNAMAWLATNNQARYVRDCATMVRHYKRAEMHNMSMSAWIHRRICETVEEGSWKVIASFLKYQGVEVMRFIAAMRDLLKGVPKKSCIVIYGQPNTGKSMFAMSLIKFLNGRVISHVNAKSQFWIQPLTEAKVALLDDATPLCWDYFDVYMRNALDGNLVSIDCKYKAPVQVKCPPMIITTNYNVHAYEKWKFLRSRLTMFHFPTEVITGEGEAPIYCITDAHWKSFFQRLWTPLDLSDQEDEGDDGTASHPFRCSTRGTDGHI
ncbi:E1 protein [Tree shrew papillomavirus 2]|uniref:Replication protein E1 n=1 Tax=Tree shrew papillomavirus 2 TaxID=2562516 RepID=A0AAE6D0R4_9PAPI|nr:E1 protein [Tree shrew papillomavirus 2]